MKNITQRSATLLMILVFGFQAFAGLVGKSTDIDRLISIDDSELRLARYLNPEPLPSPTPVKNGIYVDPVKVLDDRSVAQNLQQIEANLANLRFFDQISLSAAIGTLQGARSDSSSLSASVTTKPSPSFETATTTDTGATGAVATKIVETEKQGSNSPAVPAAPQPTPAFTPPSNFRLSAQDLLAEQMSMTYQIINLRTFLQRSLSDRRLGGTYSEKKGDVTSDRKFAGARAVAVLGFNISVNNPKQYKDAVAEVKIEIANKESLGTTSDGTTFEASYEQPPSLIMQSPIEKTYNVATITKDSKSFSLGAAVQVLNVGVAAEKKSETLYLVRDNDTVAFSDRPFEDGEFSNDGCSTAGDKAISFGWQFRPVLGRRSVEPGPRKVMAMLALPNSTNLPFTGTIRVQTRWLKYDRKNKLVGAPVGDVMTQCLGDLDIQSIQDTKKSLEPSFGPQWTNIGSGLASITLTGENLLSGTSIVVGDTNYGASSPEFRQSGEDKIQLIVPIQKLAQFNDIFMSSEYGGLQPVRNDSITSIPPGGFDPRTKAGWGVGISSISASSTDGQAVSLEIKVNPKVLATGGNPAVRPMLIDGMHHAVIVVGDQVFDVASLPVIDDPNDANSKLISLKIPIQLANTAGKLTIKDFFWGSDYSSTARVDLTNVFSVNKVDILASDTTSTWLAVRGTKFNNSYKVIANGTEYSNADSSKFKFRSPNLIEIKVELPESQLKNIKQLTVTDGTMYLAATVSSPMPKLTMQLDKVGTIAEGEVKDILAEGINLNNVSFVLFVNDRIPFSASGDGKSGILTVTRELSRVRGNQQLNFVLKDGTVISYLLKITSP